MIEQQYTPDIFEKFMVAAQVVRCPSLPHDLYDYHLKSLENNPELREVLEAIGLSVQALISLDDRFFSALMWGIVQADYLVPRIEESGVMAVEIGGEPIPLAVAEPSCI